MPLKRCLKSSCVKIQMQSEQPLSLKRQACVPLKWNRKMESCFGDYSDYENAPGGLATFGGFFCDFGGDYDFQKTVSDYRL
nr:MAG TPA: hypothetical protein [Caudoviricetes sp.]